MDKIFNSKEYIQELAQELIRNFTSAGKATTPSLIGTAKESEVRTKLAKIFPPLVSVGTGCVIDSKNNVSKQTDIIIYEKDFCPIFSINDTPEASYFPCESVIAVGEIKSTLNDKELNDSIEKIKSVKSLDRFFVRTDGTRSYGSKLTVHQMTEHEYNQKKNVLDQIFGFILCESFGLSIETILERLTKIYSISESFLLPNIIFSLKDGLILFYDKEKEEFTDSKNDATGIIHCNFPTGNFQYLLHRINYFINNGRSTHILPFEKYIIEQPSENMPYLYRPFITQF
jgi:hypothetical protein